MKLIFENWRKFKLLTEITFNQAVDRMKNSKVLYSFVKGRAWDPETKTLALSDNMIKYKVDLIAKSLLKLIPRDLTDNQRGLSLEWLLSKGLKDESFADAIWGSSTNRPADGFFPNPRAQQNLLALEEIPSSLETYFQWKDFMEKKDIFSITSVEELMKVVENAREKIYAYQEAKDYKDHKKGTEVLREDDQWSIYVLHNKGAACYHGRGTDWCTAAPGLDFFETYYSPKDPIFYFNPKSDSVEPELSKDSSWNPPFQFHFGSEQFMKQDDKPVSYQVKQYLIKLLMGTRAEKKYAGARQYSLIAKILGDADDPSVRTAKDAIRLGSLGGQEASQIIKSKNLDIDELFSAVVERYEFRARKMIQGGVGWSDSYDKELRQIMMDCADYKQIELGDRDYNRRRGGIQYTGGHGCTDFEDDIFSYLSTVPKWARMTHGLSGLVGNDDPLAWDEQYLATDIVIDEFENVVFPDWEFTDIGREIGFPIEQYRLKTGFKKHLEKTKKEVKQILISMFNYI